MEVFQCPLNKGLTATFYIPNCQRRDYEYITNNNLNEEIIGALESVIKKTQEIINELR